MASDPYVAIAFWTGLAALLLTLLLALQILRLRILLNQRKSDKDRTFAKWRPVLNAALTGEPPHVLPPLTQDEQQPFLTLWIHLQASMRGEARNALNDIARRLGLDQIAREMLDKGQRAEKLLAMLMLGYLHDTQAWPPLLRLAEQNDHTLSLNALWALVRIDPQTAAEYMTPLFIEREHWALSRVATILQEANEFVAAVLAQMLPRLEAAHLARGLRLAEALRMDLPADFLATVLYSKSVPIVIAGLRNVRNSDMIADVRVLLSHEDWNVRVQSAKALGRIGDRSEAGRLVPLLQDPQWWVRYRAAQSLLELPAISLQEIENLRSSLSDRFAADMLTQVMAEKGLA